jgi:hypothetical protein
VFKEGKVENDRQHQQEKRAELAAIWVGKHGPEHASERSKPKPNADDDQQDKVGRNDEIIQKKRSTALPYVCKLHVIG